MLIEECNQQQQQQNTNIGYMQNVTTYKHLEYKDQLPLLYFNIKLYMLEVMLQCTLYMPK